MGKKGRTKDSAVRKKKLRQQTGKQPIVGLAGRIRIEGCVTQSVSEICMLYTKRKGLEWRRGTGGDGGETEPFSSPRPCSHQKHQNNPFDT